MLDISDYIIDEPYRQYGNGYDQLDGEWLTYYKIASRFSHKVRFEDRDDVLHTIMLNLAQMARSNHHKPDNPSWMYRIASFTVAQYWRTYYKHTNGLDCHNCSKAQRHKCRKDWLYSECPKAIKLEYLSKPVTDGDGNLTELGELIADNKALDLAEWLDIKTFLRGCPQRLIGVGYKIRQGLALDGNDRKYLCKWRKREQKRLF